MNRMRIALILNAVAVLCFAAALITQNFYLTGLGGITLLGAGVIRILEKKQNSEEK